jgi:predicted small integral membrane protein
MYARRASCQRHSSRCLVAKLSRVSARRRRGSPGKYLLQSWATTRGKRLAPYWTFVDSGYLPTEVYKFCRSGTHRFPTKGIGTASMPWVEPTPEKRHGLLHIRTAAGKYLFYSRLAINERTADGYVHLPMSSTPPCKRVRWGFFFVCRQTIADPLI